MNELKTALETKAQNVINVTYNQSSELEKELNTIKEQLKQNWDSNRNTV